MPLTKNGDSILCAGRAHGLHELMGHRVAGSQPPAEQTLTEARVH